MVDLYGADKGNISLPPRLRSPEVLEGQPDDLKQVMILNMQKAFYHVRITDIAKRIQRLQSRNAGLENDCAIKKLVFSENDIESADQITQLNRQIFGETEKIAEYQKRIGTVRKWMDEETQAHMDKVETENEKYAKTRLEITSEIKVFNAKINTLEEYKVSKSDLRNKLIAGNNLIAQREKEAKQRCEQIERKFKIGREKLKREMYARLQELAGTFQTEVAASLAKPIHRLMRENIFLKNELIDLAREFVPKKENILKQKIEMKEKTGDETAATKKSIVDHLIEAKIQGYLLAAVKEQGQKAKDCLDKLKQSDSEKRMHSSQDSYGSAKIQTEKGLQRLSRLETGFHRQQTQLGFVNYLSDRSKTELQRCVDLLYDAKYAVACALKRTETGKDILEMGDRQLMDYLLGILSKVKTQRWRNRTPSLATVPSAHEAYKTGDLGFEASQTEFRRSTALTIQATQSDLSTLEVLTTLAAKPSGTSLARSQIKLTDVFDAAKESEENLTDEKSYLSNMESVLSLGSQDQEQAQKSVSAVVVERVEPEAKTEVEIEPVDTTAKEPDAPKQDEADDNDTIIEQNEKEKVAASIVEEESDQTFSHENALQE